MNIIVTNNVMVKVNFEGIFQVKYIEGSFYDVLVCVRDYIHNGYILLTHPLSGSVKPNETPYKSVLISKQYSKTNENKETDFQSLQIIEDSLMSIKKFIFREIPEQYLSDLRKVDFTLINSAIANHL